MGATSRESSTATTRFLAEDAQSMSMENRKRLKATFGTQANALLRKNITYQVRGIRLSRYPELSCYNLEGIKDVHELRG